MTNEGMDLFDASQENQGRFLLRIKARLQTAAAFISANKRNGILHPTPPLSVMLDYVW